MTLNFGNLRRGALGLLVILISCKSADLGTPGDQAAARSQAEARLGRLVDGARFGEALALADSLLSIGVKGPGVLGGKARALAALGKSKEAIAAFEEAVLVDYENCENHMHFATYLMRLGKTGRAHTEFMEAKRFCGAQFAPLIYRNLAVSGIKLGKLDVARKYVDEGLESNPDDPYLSGLKGMLIAHEHPLAAESLFVKSQMGGDATGDFLFQYGLLLINEGRPVEAIQALEKALRKRPGDREIRVNLAEALDRALKYGESEAVLRDLLAEKEEEEIWEKLAGVLYHKKSYEDALQLYRNLRQSPEVMDKIAMCLHNLGRPDEALPWSRKALAAKPDWPQWMINLAVVLAAKGELGEASSLLERVLKIEPDNATARVNLDRLRDALGQ
jgi:tetratricopeptide (TPR) repeat protein